MLRHCAAAFAAATVLFQTGAKPARAQSPVVSWSPPGREMPAMPRMSDLPNWRGAVGAWFGGVPEASGVPAGQVEARGEAAGAGRAKFVRFSAGARPVAVWTDRNGDGRCDLLEIYRNGAVVAQVVDPDYDGTANVVRLYDADGALARETRL